MKCNLNNTIKFKPTKRGLEIVKEDIFELHTKDEIEEVMKIKYKYDGQYMETELWDFMNLFGNQFLMGMKGEDYPCEMNVEIIGHK
jgi:hypothetical protein